MDRICQYSTIIFAGNVSVLLLVAITTDYWEYRGFRTQDLIPRLKKLHNRLHLVFPSDTQSYFVVEYYWDPPPVKMSIFATTPVPKREQVLANYTLVYYQPPAVLIKKLEDFVELTDTVHFDGVRNVTTTMPIRKTRPLEDKLVLFIQYTNLFRECDILEAGVRVRLGLSSLRQHRCFNFISHNRKDDFIALELPAAMHLERIAFTMSVVCIFVSVISLVSGAYGLITSNRGFILTASSAACASGMAMTVAIAIFHGKCHLIHRHEFFAGVDLPFKKTVEEHREHYYGWSFGLAWICVSLCFIHTWVWLVTAQDIPDMCFPGRSSWRFFRYRRRRHRHRRRKKPRPLRPGLGSGPGGPGARLPPPPPPLPQLPGRRQRRVGDNWALPRCLPGRRPGDTLARLVVAQGLTIGLVPPSLPMPISICINDDDGDDDNDNDIGNSPENVYSVIHSRTAPGMGPGVSGTASTAAAAAAAASIADHCPPCGRSLARFATNGDLRRASAVQNGHVGTQCRGLSKSAGNFLFLSSRTAGDGDDDNDYEEYRILNRAPDEFKVLLRPSETLKAFSADTLNFP